MSRVWIRHGLLGAAVVLGAAGVAGSLSTGDLPGNGDSWGHTVSFIGFALLGWFIVGRRPELPIGWLYLAGGSTGAAAFLASWWSFESLLRDPGSLPGGPIAACLAVWLSPLSWPLVLLAPLVLFPTGRVRTRRWFWFMTVTGATIGIMVAVAVVVSLPVAARNAVEFIDAPGHAATGGASTAYRVAAEALTNVVRHSRATACTLRVAHDGGMLHIEVADNGSGFDTSMPTGMGVRNMHNRAGTANGVATISSSPDLGTSVVLDVPL